MTVETAGETRTPMTWEDYEALGEVRGEYFGGHLVVAAFPTHHHQDIVFQLAKLVEPTVPDHARMVLSWGWSPAGVREELGPDLMVHRSAEDKRLTDSAALLVVEVLSTNRSTDLVDKMQRYARWGAATYWVVDLRDHEIVEHVLRDGMYTVAATHRSGVVTLRYGEVHVEVDVDALLR